MRVYKLFYALLIIPHSCVSQPLSIKSKTEISKPEAELSKSHYIYQDGSGDLTLTTRNNIPIEVDISTISEKHSLCIIEKASINADFTVNYDDCSFKIELKEDSIDISFNDKAKSCYQICGIGAYFDGKYIKSSK